MLSGIRQFAAKTLGGAARWLSTASASAGWDAMRRLLPSYGGEALGALDNPMERQSAVYRGVTAIAQTIGGLPLVLHAAGAPDRIITSGPAFDLLHGSEGLTTNQFCEQWAGHLVEGGEAHIIIERGAVSGYVRQLTIAGRREMTAVRNGLTGNLETWDYTASGSAQLRSLRPDEVATAAFFNPYDRLRGLGPLKAAALGIKQDYLAALFNVAALTNGGSVGGFYSLPGEPTAEQRKEYLAAIEARHSGPGKANKPGLLWGGADYKQTAFKNADLELLPARKFNREEIFNALGVPSVIVAIFESAHYDVADKSIEIYFTVTIQPLVMLLMALLNRRVLPLIEPGVQCYLDMNGHPVLQRLNWAKIDALTKAVVTGVPYNEAGPLVGLKLKPQAWGDTSLLPATLAPAAEIATGLSAPPETTPGDPADEPPTNEGATPPRPRNIATAASEARVEERMVRAAAPRIARQFRAFFARQQRMLLARLQKEMSGRSKAPDWNITIDDDEIEAIAKRVLLDISAEQSALRKMASAYFPDTAVASLRSELTRIGIEADRIDTLVEAFKSGKFLSAMTKAKASKITGIERVTRARVQRELVSGLRAGETVAELSERVRAVTGDAAFRVNRIARTEAGQAVSTGRFAAAKSVGAQAKAWLTGSNPRDTHVAAGRRYTPAAAIDIDTAFVVGDDTLMYPRDPRGSAGEIVNCNCVMITVRKAAEEDQTEGAATWAD